MAITVDIYEDNKNLSTSLRLLINASNDLSVSGAYFDCLNILENTRQNRPDVIIMDINMPGINGVDGVKICKKVFPQVLILMFTVFEDDKQLFEALCAGANGYLLKKSAPQKLIAAIRDVYNGGAPLSPSIAKKTFDKHTRDDSKFNLTEREVEILQLLSHGKTYKNMALELHISIDTVRKHLQNIYTKLHVNCGSQAVAIALRNNIIQ